MIDAQWMPLLYAALLLLAGTALLILEFFIVSFGLLSAAALSSAVAAVYFAFQLGPAIGYGFIVLATGLAAVTVRWGLAQLRSSSAVPKAEISGNAGYHHLAQRIGVKVGSIGVLVTPALPSGRARFAGGECDIQVRSGSLEANAKVLVERIDGPIIFVTAAEQD
jgi:membrane-bound ClpP family serine protease